MKDLTTEDLSYSEIVKFVNDKEEKSLNYPTFKIAFLRNITIDPLLPYLKYFCYKERIKLQTWMGDYDLILQEILNSNSELFKFSPDLIIICIKPENFAEELYNKFTSLNYDRVKNEIQRITLFIENIINTIKQNSNATVLIHNFEVPIFPNFGILDYQDISKQIFTFRKINKRMLKIAKKFGGTYVLDADLLQSKVGYFNYIDKRYWHIGKAPYTRTAYKYISLEYIKFIRAIAGKNKKCLVLDCDNTLWGGVVGEDGFNNIKIGNTYPGSCYQDFQKTILNLYERGVLLALCSKNNNADVLDILKNHPDMILRENHFVSMKINWNDKVSNLKEIANDLNINLDSFVFMDDSEFEINIVKQLLPEVTAILLPKDPSIYSDLLNSLGVFDTLNISEEDRKRTEMYKTDFKRKEAFNNFASQNLEDYYKDLEMEIFINSADEFTIPRIAQLTQKTNQFNFTSKRYTESNIKDFSQSNNLVVFSLSLKDRFGDMGIVGTAIVKYQSDEAVIDTFLLSCRVIGRNIEKVLLMACIQAATQKNCKKIYGMFIPSKKNQICSDFYVNNGFTLIQKENEKLTFLYNSVNPSINIPKYFKSVKINEKEFI